MTITLDFSGDRKVIDNLEAVTITNPDGVTASTNFALKRASQAITYEQGGAELVIVGVRWHVWKADLGTFVPAKNGFVTQQNGARWFIDDVGYETFQERFALTCTSEARTTVA